MKPVAKATRWSTNPPRLLDTQLDYTSWPLSQLACGHMVEFYPIELKWKWHTPFSDLTIKPFYAPCSFSFCWFNVDEASNPRSYMLKIVDPRHGKIWISESSFGAEWTTNHEILFFTSDDWETTFRCVWFVTYFEISFIAEAPLC